jgi:hypothetical protein
MRLALDLTRRAPRNAEFGDLQETFLISGVTMILVIRTQLWLTNYPQLGGHGLHIAHLLWGGLFMVVAIGILLTFLGPSPRGVAAVVGGIGFGFFIDELGKFITSDNNYFFKPAAALIYLIFVALFGLTRSLQHRRALSSEERVANALDIVGEATKRRFDEVDRERALAMLDAADPADPLVEPVRRLVLDLDTAPTRPRRLAGWAEKARDGYTRLVAQSWFRPLIDAVFALWALLSVIAVFEVVLSLGVHVGGAMRGFGSDSVDHLAFINIASLVSSLVSASLVGVGLVRLHRAARLSAYRAFERALFVSIFVTRVFAFVESQFAAVFGLAVDLVLLIVLRSMIGQERELEQEPGAPTAEPVAAAI